MKKEARTATKDSVFDVAVMVLCAVIMLICAYPLYYTILCSFSDPYSVCTGKVGLLPVGFTLESYRQIMANTSIWRGYFWQIVYTVAGTAYNLVLTIPLAYALSKKELYGRTIITWYFVFCMYFSGGMIPTYLVVKQLGLIDTPWVMIVGAGVSVYNMIVGRVYFQSIPEPVYEAARIDGASEFRILLRIALPLSMPIVAVLALYYGVDHWNDYFTALIYITNKRIQPLQLVLRQILIQNENAFTSAISGGSADLQQISAAARRTYLAITMKYALVFVSSAPMLIAYPFVQKYFIKGVMIGSIKG